MGGQRATMVINGRSIKSRTCTNSDKEFRRIRRTPRNGIAKPLRWVIPRLNNGFPIMAYSVKRLVVAIAMTLSDGQEPVMSS